MKADSAPNVSFMTPPIKGPIPNPPVNDTMNKPMYLPSSDFGDRIPIVANAEGNMKDAPSPIAILNNATIW